MTGEQTYLYEAAPRQRQLPTPVQTLHAASSRCSDSGYDDGRSHCGTMQRWALPLPLLLLSLLLFLLLLLPLLLVLLLLSLLLLMDVMTRQVAVRPANEYAA